MGKGKDGERQGWGKVGIRKGKDGEGKDKERLGCGKVGMGKSREGEGLQKKRKVRNGKVGEGECSVLFYHYTVQYSTLFYLSTTFQIQCTVFIFQQPTNRQIKVEKKKFYVQFEKERILAEVPGVARGIFFSLIQPIGSSRLARNSSHI